jgi:hypothetical protein
MSMTVAIKSDYPKIETIFNRNPANMRNVVMGELRMPEFGLIDDWHVTEKIHGTNIRVIYEDGIIRFGGKTDNAQMPMYLLEALRPMFNVDKFAEIWPREMGEEVVDDGLPNAAEHNASLGYPPWPQVVLYGEGYGAKIQKGGGNYRPDQSFRLFDVAVLGIDGRNQQPKWWWLEWENVEDVAHKFEISTVPVLADHATTQEAIQLVRQDSVVARLEGSVAVAHEGVVCRTVPQLYTRRGNRLIWKLKGSDLPEEA